MAVLHFLRSYERVGGVVVRTKQELREREAEEDFGNGVASDRYFHRCR